MDAGVHSCMKMIALSMGVGCPRDKYHASERRRNEYLLVVLYNLVIEVFGRFGIFEVLTTRFVHIHRQLKRTR